MNWPSVSRVQTFMFLYPILFVFLCHLELCTLNLKIHLRCLCAYSDEQRLLQFKWKPIGILEDLFYLYIFQGNFESAMAVVQVGVVA